MEGLAPPLELLIAVKNAIECGESVRSGITKYVGSAQTEYAKVVAKWLLAFDQNGQHAEIIKSIESSYRQAILRVLEHGLKGQSILPILNELEKEINDACRREVDQFIALLPVKLLVPLLLFQFPSYLILLLGPLIKTFIGAFK